MKTKTVFVFLSSVLLLCALTIFELHAQQSPSKNTPPASSWKAVDEAMGRTGHDQPDGTHKFSRPQSDMKVTLDGVGIKPGLALGSWAAFQKMGNQTEVMGDLVLAENEVGPVMQKLGDSGIEITALHNHLMRESPPVMYMHIEGHGDAAHLAAAIHDALSLTKTPTAAPPSNPAQSETANLQFDSTGDFVLTAREVNPLIKTLRQNGIAVTALHSHMLEEQPRLFFMHFWANDDAVKLAKGLRAALDQTNSAKEKGLN